MNNINLPALQIQPIKYSIGEAKFFLRDERNYSIVEESDVKISARRSEKCFKLDNNEKIIVTQKKKIDCPSGVDGVIRKLEDGSYKWLYHRLVEEKNNLIKKSGLKSISNNVVDTWQNNFTYGQEELDSNGITIPGKEGLRPPQLGALYAIGAHWSINNNPATIVMPTGTGKTETILSTLPAYKPRRLIVAVPSKALREQTRNKFLNFGLLRHLNVLNDSASNPVVGVITSRPKSKNDLAIFQDCNVIVGVMSSLSDGTASKFINDIADITDVLVLDEAHHVAAKTWSEFREAFTKNKVLQFTATPFRRDGKLVDGDVIYSYSLKRAQQDGYFKNIKFEPVFESSIEKSDLAISKKSIEQLKDDLENGYDHLILARCGSISRANSVCKIYEKLVPEYRPQLIHSKVADASLRLHKVKNGESKIIVCVEMLGEGFDLPELKIAAIHDPHKSLSVVLQFTGRFTRTSGKNLGDASVIANIADMNVSTALERLYSEDSDWNLILSEMSSEAAKEHAELIKFLNDSTSIEYEDIELGNISPHLLRPSLSTLFFKANKFFPKKFHEGLPRRYQIKRVWLNENLQTLFFVTMSSEKVVWSRSKGLLETAWDLFVIHYDSKRKLIYLNSTEKKDNFARLAKAIGANQQIAGEDIFRCLGRVNRLMFQNIGVSKHGRRNLSYAMYTGADVSQALSLSEKAGSRKSNLSGSGWEAGKQTTIGCSYKGRVWSIQKGTIPQFVSWSENMGDKLSDEKISTEEIIDNVLIPEEVSTLPEVEALGIEWPVELLIKSEERVSLESKDENQQIYMTDLQLDDINKIKNEITFSVTKEENIWGQYKLNIGGKEGYNVKRISDQEITLNIGNFTATLEQFFNDYPPLIRYVDLSELDGNLVLRARNPKDINLTSDRFEIWDWKGTDFTKESIWKDAAERKDSIQWAAAQHFISGGFPIVFDDDGPGEAADLVCLNEQEQFIQLALVHCKYSGGPSAGVRIKDVVEVASQAIRSAKWPGRFRELCSHLLNRYEKRCRSNSRNCMLNGSLVNISNISRAARFKEIKANILIVQPGISKDNLSSDQSQVLGAAASYLKETINVDLDIVCSK